LKKNTLLYSFLFFFACHILQAQSIQINEILTSNTVVNTDDDGTYQDWVELYNPSETPVSLAGYGLSDDPAAPYKWVFPEFQIAASGHVLIWCSDKNRRDPLLPLHANFKISSDGEPIVLTRPDGQISDLLPAIAVPQNQSYGRIPSGGSTFGFFTAPTPGSQNQSQETGTLSPPLFSVASGFYNDAFTLVLSHPDPGVQIYYTLDGSEPNPGNMGGKTYSYKNSYAEFPGQESGPLLTENFKTLAYADPVYVGDRNGEPNKISSISTTYNYEPAYLPQYAVSKSTVVRAIAVKEGAVSRTVTQNYFIGVANQHHLPIASINTDEDLLFGYDHGIHVAGKLFDDWRAAAPDAAADGNSSANYSQSGDDWEIKANFSYFAAGHETVNQDVGIRINGGWSRISPAKALRIYARSDYGSGDLNYPFFGPDYGFNSFKRLLLRNSGNDIYSTYFRDAFIQRSVSHLHFTTQPYQPCVTFINGEYWGLLNIRERYDKTYYERIFGIPDNALDLIENGWDAQEGDTAHYDAMVNYFGNNNLETDENFETASTFLDTENYTDYYIANIYADNTDWPHNNVLCWRKKTETNVPGAAYGHDGRWRWSMKDTDFGFGASGNPSSNTLEFATNGNPYSEAATLIIRKLLDNATYRNHFINRFADLINTTYQPGRLTGIIDAMQQGIEAEMPEHLRRWNALNIASWNDNVQVMRQFALLRPEFQRDQLREKFGMAQNVSTTLDSNPEQGYITINTIDLLPSTPGVAENPYPWNGIYFSGIPVTVRATPLPGYTFSHWSGSYSGNEEAMTFTPTADFSLTAHFIPDFNAEAPIAFWLSDTSMANDRPLTAIASTFETAAEGILEYQSCLTGYPYAEGDPLWRKASLERVNSPTAINYLPQANNGIGFPDSNMRGLQVRQPFRSGSAENTLLFHQPTLGYADIIVRFAAKNEAAASALLIDYSTTGGLEWTSAGLSTNLMPLADDYQLYEIDFSQVQNVGNNAGFAFRIRFAGDDLTADSGGRVVFNNFSISGTPALNSTLHKNDSFAAYPNPASDVLHLQNISGAASYRFFSLDGKMILSGWVAGPDIDLSSLPKGLFLLQLTTSNAVFNIKIVKK